MLRQIDGRLDKSQATGFRWLRTVATAFSILFVLYALWSIWINYSNPSGIDFVSFWAAGRLAFGGHPSTAYDIAIHRALELTTGKIEGLQPFPYPPPFLLTVLPFGIPSFVMGFAAWIAATALVYYWVFRRIAPWPYTFAHPANFSNALVGQNGMLTSAIFAGGFLLLDRRRLIAGALLGLLVIKPQLGLLIPVALIAGGHWRAIVGAVLSASALLALTFIAFGEGTYNAFFLNATHQATLLTGLIPWPKVASVFGALRTMGVPLIPALLIHSAVATAAAVTTWLAWRRNLSTRLPIIAAATLLISPYLLGHDSLLMMVPIGWLIAKQRRPAIVALLWTISMVAVAAVIPNPTPVAATIAIAVMWQEASRLTSEPENACRDACRSIEPWDKSG